MGGPFDELISDAMLRQRAMEFALQALNNSAMASPPEDYVRYAERFLAFLQPDPPVPQAMERAA